MAFYLERRFGGLGSGLILGHRLIKSSGRLNGGGGVYPSRLVLVDGPLTCIR